MEETMKDELATLLAHETDDVVPAEHERLIREGLGALLAAAPPIAPAAAPTPAPAPAAAATLKLTTAALLGLGLAAGGFALGRVTAPESPAPAPTAAPSVVVVPSAVVAPPAITTPPSASTSAAPVVSAPAPHAPAVTTSASPSAFDREQSLLERARAALVRHDAAAAGEALDALDAQFPASRHGEERDYLRIQLLRERGDTAAVRERAKAFLAAHPDSLLRARVEPLAR